MNPAEYERMYRYEDHYWWFVSRRELVDALVRQLSLPPNPVIVDVGCGTGATAVLLQQYGMVVGVDISPLALSWSRQRGLEALLLAAAERLPLLSESVDVIVATDILEHLDDDVAVLEEFRRVLRPGGCVVVTVPAYRILWSEHDLALMHRRRYIASVLAKRARLAGFEIAKLTYALFFLFPLALVMRLLKRRPPPHKEPEAQLPPLPQWLNQLLIRFQRMETALLKRVRFPWGVSVVAVLRKP
ncbi:MAG: class I SAM-dependent methyltransferase [Armatimonadota bacterium]|nr:methyltransferase domain-containing protein [bacterium]MCS7309838.1 methyltransferase domain-containing protein [Armatimonadota bacterium]MDW8104645.1 class I SAM-dependent methyltransferase [Armatimonadota bacterium]MDW8291191.1 class I SAM-dependent methyltransferase [Armatimonadota bacterium]